MLQSFIFFSSVAFLIIFSFSVNQSFAAPGTLTCQNHLCSSSLSLFDKTRHRSIPIQIYFNDRAKLKAITEKQQMPVVMINHGYTVKNTEYSAIAYHLAEKGYFVVSIQHDLMTDPKISQTGNIYKDRKPLWERGVMNILYVKKELAKTYPFINLNKVFLIGHSNGADIAILFAKNHANLTSAVISLDGLRMAPPRQSNLFILLIQANDTQPDPGVLPNEVERKKWPISIAKLSGAKHIDLCDQGKPTIQQKINQLIDSFLTGLPIRK